jgi:hypothetical protein
MKNIIILVIFCVTAMFFSMCCNGTNDLKNKTNARIRYFSFAEQQKTRLVAVPFDEISKEDALKKGTYCIVYYNDIGQIITVKDIVDNKKTFTNQYEYYGNGIVKRRKNTHHAEGKITIIDYDEKGNRLKYPLFPIEPNLDSGAVIKP